MLNTNRGAAGTNISNDTEFALNGLKFFKLRAQLSHYAADLQDVENTAWELTSGALPVTGGQRPGPGAAPPAWPPGCPQSVGTPAGCRQDPGAEPRLPDLLRAPLALPLQHKGGPLGDPCPQQSPLGRYTGTPTTGGRATLQMGSPTHRASSYVWLRVWS